MRLDITKLVLLSALFVGTTTACSKDEETDTNVAGDDEVCDDGEDNDGDDDVDCDDSDCDGEADCLPTEELDCDNGDDDDGDGDVDCDDSDCATDNDCEPEYFTPAYYNIVGGFGYDSATGKIVGAIADGNAISPWVSFVFIEEDYLSTGEDQYLCSVAWYYEGGAPLDLEIMVDADGLTHGGFKADITDEVAWVVGTDCTEEDGKLIDPEVIPDSDVIAWITAGITEIGVGVGQASADVQTVIDEQVDPADAIYFGGAGLWTSDGTDGGYGAPNYSLGYAVDENMNLLVDGDANVLLLAEDYSDGSGVPVHGYYQTSLLYVYAL